MDMSQVIKNTLLTSDAPLHIQEHTPQQYEDREFEYFTGGTHWFVDLYAKYSNDYTYAEIQGLDPSKPFVYVPCHIRFAEVVTSSAASTREFDDYKNILVAEKEYTYLRKGAKVRTMGSTWLVINPNNMSGGDGVAIIQRCDAVWHYLDYYGNVCSEPMAVGKDALRANDPDSQRSTMVTKGYFTAKAQYNEATKSLLNNNSRMIFGSGAYHLSGFMDFIQEFTSVEDSVNMLEFTLRWEEPDDALDDMENKVAGGKTFNWQIIVEGKNVLAAGGATKLSATSIRTSEGTQETVSDSAAHPITYEWSTSDSAVCTVDSEGNLTGVAEGTATITCTLVQNPSKKATYDIVVEGSAADPHVEFNSDIPENIRAYTSVKLSAAYYENGEEAEETIKWKLSGASESAYSYTVSGNEITINCWGGSVNALVVKASCHGETATASIQLIGI